MIPILLSSVCDINSGFNWGQVGQCFTNTPYFGVELSFIAIIVFFVLIVLISNLRIGAWYAVAGVLATFFLVSGLPNEDVAFMIWIIVVLVLPATMFIPAIQKFINR